jgi:hypothetical protein
LVAKPRSGVKPKLNESVKQQIVGMKKKDPEYGPRRITDVLKRFFWFRPEPPAFIKRWQTKG